MPSVLQAPLSLRHLLIALTALGILPLALLGVWGLYIANDYQEKAESRHLLDLARALSSAVDTELDATVMALTALGREKAFTSSDFASLHELSRRQAAVHREWISVSLADSTGTLLFRSSEPYGENAGPPLDPASLQKVLMLDQPLVGQTTRDPKGKFGYPVRVPLKDASGRTFVLTARIQPERMVRVLLRQKVPDNSVIAIIDASRTVAARIRNGQITSGGSPSPSLLQLMQTAGREGAGKSRTLEGVEVTSAFSHSGRYGWAVAVGVPTKSLSPAVLPGFAAYAIGIFLSLTACIALATLLANRIVAAFGALQAGTAALGAGDAVQAGSSWIREVEVMHRALDTAYVQSTAHAEERSRLLLSLEQALDQARTASRVKDEFLAVLGHELRNPLSPIVGSLDLMDLRQEPTSSRERAVMRRQVNHLRRLVDDLLDASRISSGKLDIRLARVNFSDLVRDHAINPGGREVTVTSAEQVWVMGDESRLVQVLHNLLSNAARFSTESIAVDVGADSTHAILTVRDRGIGMAPEMLSRVFELFYQAPQPLARATGGLGLGLAIVKKIVELHGGEVDAHSAGQGQGSSFMVRIPLAEPSEAAISMPADAANATTAMDVLLVDDNRDAAATVAMLLEHMGCSVRVAHTAQEAMALFKEAPAAVAILDIGLPDMDGYALASALREIGGNNALRLVALTGYAQSSDVQRAYQSGFHHHLTKPASMDDLRAALDAE